MLEEKQDLGTKINRLSHFSLNCTKGEQVSKDLFQVLMQAEIGMIIDLQFKDKSFSHILEFDGNEFVLKLLESNLIDLRGSKAFLMQWRKYFNWFEVMYKRENFFSSYCGFAKD